MPSSPLFPKWGSITTGIEVAKAQTTILRGRGGKVEQYPPEREFRKSLPPTEHEEGLQLVNKRSQTISPTQRPQESVVFQWGRACWVKGIKLIDSEVTLLQMRSITDFIQHILQDVIMSLVSLQCHSQQGNVVT